VIFNLSLPSVEKKHSVKKLFAEFYIFDTQQRSSLPSVLFLTLGKELLCQVFSFTESFLLGTRQRASLPSARKKTLGKTFGTRQRAEFR
jgi:hypothetical protein